MAFVERACDIVANNWEADNNHDMQLRGVAALLLFGAVAHGAEIRLGAEMPLSSERPGESQLAPVVTTSGNHVVALWRDEAGLEMRGVADGVSFTIGVTMKAIDPRTAIAIAAGNRNALIVWTEGTESNRPLFARRIEFNGMTDAVPISLGSTNSIGIGSLQPFGAVDDGDAFVVVWPSASQQLGNSEQGHRARVSPDGFVVRDDTFQVSAAGLRPVRTRSGIAIVGSKVYITCIPYCHWVTGYFVFPNNSGVWGGNGLWSVAANDDHLTIASASDGNPELWIAQSALDGVRIGFVKIATEHFYGIALVWSGTEYVLAWNDGERVRAIRLDGNGKAIDSAPFDVSSPFTNHGLEAPSLAVVPSGVLIVYSRRDSASGVARAYGRVLERLGGPRRRVVRH